MGPMGIVAFVLVCLMSIRPGWGEEYTGVPVTLQAGDVLSGALLEGADYRVDDVVQNDGLINVYRLATRGGPLTVESTAELEIRVTELIALAKMEQLDRADVFGDAVVKGAKGTVEGVASFATSPVETTKNVVAGAGQFFSSIGRALVSDDPHQDNVFKVALGYDAAKRAFAYEFGVDPYSTYEPLVDRLGEIARSAVAGGLTTKVVLANVDQTVVTVLRWSGTANSMRKLVRDNPPGKLREINQGKLLAMGVDERLAEAFLNNYSYNPQEETLLVGELESMDGVAGRDAFAAMANLAGEPVLARLYRLTAQMVAGYHRSVSAVERICDVASRPLVVTKSGALILLAPVDHVFWTKEVAAKLQAIERSVARELPDISSKELWITGRVDDSARTQLEARGWKVTESANAILQKDG